MHSFFRPTSQHELLGEAVELGFDLRLRVEADPEDVAHYEVTMVPHSSGRRLHLINESTKHETEVTHPAPNLHN